MKEMLQRAKAAYPSWKNRGFDERASFALRYKEVLKNKREHIARTISEEMGKPLWESRTEVDSMINKVDISIKAYHERCKEEKDGIRATRFHPHGIVAVFGPFNFPGHLPNGHIVPALLAGNVILFKPSEKTPCTGQLIYDCWQEAGLPEGVFQIIQGDKEVAEAIVAEPEVMGIYFTGSVQAGLAIQMASLQFPGRIVALEMGGNNPLVVTTVKDIAAAIYVIIQSAFITSGQRCSCARRLIITDDKILSPLIESVKKLRVGRYDTSPEPFMGPVVNEQSAKQLESSYQKLVQQGGKPLLPLKRDGATIYPTIIDMTGCKIEDEELFGPILQVIRTKNLDEAIAEANNTAFGLVAGLISDSSDEYKVFYDKTRAGVINWNMPTTGASSLAPFGGVGLSGNFRPSGYFAADYAAYPVASQESAKPKLPETLPPGVQI